jgi:DNA-binding NarL/FixJ family response regulator
MSPPLSQESGVLIFYVAHLIRQERLNRRRAERLVRELEESHRQLQAYATQVAELATTEERNRLAHRGIYQLDPSIAGKLVGTLTGAGLPAEKTPPSPTAADDLSVLTEREIEVLRLIATGATNREIAQELVISEGTVKNHVSNILTGLGLRDRTQAAIYAREHNLIVGASK